MQRGLMDEIKERLEENVSSGELIAMGYRPATVYKAQRAWRDSQQQDGEPQDELVDQTALEEPELEAYDESREETTDDSEGLRAELEILRLHVEAHKATTIELDEVVVENESLKRRLASMDQQARELVGLRRRVGLSEANRHFSHHAQAKLQQQLSSTELQLKNASEQRTQLEHQLAGAKVQIATLKNDYVKISEELQLHKQHIGRLSTKLQSTMPLKVWAGHPCSACRKPMSGVVSHDMAKVLLRDLGHQACLEQQNSNVGKWLLGGASAIYGISKIR